MLGDKTYVYDNADHVTDDSTTGSFGGYSTTYGFDSTSRLTSEVRTGSSSYTKSYTYDGMGNRTQKIENGTPTNYTYNVNGRITSDGSNSYIYDNNGNLTSKGTTESYSYDWNAPDARRNFLYYLSLHGCRLLCDAWSYAQGKGDGADAVGLFVHFFSERPAGAEQC